MNLKPIKDQLVILPDPQAEKIGSIYVPETVQADNPNYFTMTGKVVARAESDHRFDVLVGDRVVFNRYAGKQVTCDDDRVLYLIMREEEILGVADEEDITPGYMAPSSAEVNDFKDAKGNPIDPVAGKVA